MCYNKHRNLMLFGSAGVCTETSDKTSGHGTPCPYTPV